MFGNRVTREEFNRLSNQQDNLQREFSEMKAHQNECDYKHDQAVEHQRRVDDKLDDLLMTVKQILVTLKDISPVVDRSRNSYVTLDGIKQFALWIAAIAAGVAGTAALIHYLQ